MNSKPAQTSVATSVSSWPIASILTIVFVILKLTGTIAWSWLWVFSPLWLSALFSVAVIILVFISLVVYYLFHNNEQ